MQNCKERIWMIQEGILLYSYLCIFRSRLVHYCKQLYFNMNRFTAADLKLFPIHGPLKQQRILIGPVPYLSHIVRYMQSNYLLARLNIIIYNIKINGLMS